jgi:hypothetical protein
MQAFLESTEDCADLFEVFPEFDEHAGISVRMLCEADSQRAQILTHLHDLKEGQDSTALKKFKKEHTWDRFEHRFAQCLSALEATLGEPVLRSVNCEMHNLMHS